jgi:hypothetical protein
MSESDPREREREPAPEDRPDEPGAEGGTGAEKDTPPAMPQEDDAPLGDTDQHSDADA